MQTFVASRPACACTHHGDEMGCAFRVAWTINPHMRVGAVDPERACTQHAVYVETLRAHGARVLQLPFIHGAFDSVFMKDAAVLAARGRNIMALPATPRHRERQDEPLARANQLARAGAIPVDSLATPIEGGDVVVAAHRGLAFLGHGTRSDAASARGLADYLGCDVVPLALREPALFHLDTALAVLSNDTLVLCKEAFTTASLHTLAALRFRDVVPVALDEALHFSLNVVELGDVVVSGTPSARMAAIWRSLGRTMCVSPLGEFQLAGGSAACLVAPVYDLGVSRAVARAA